MNPCMLKAENLSAIYSWVSKYSKNLAIVITCYSDERYSHLGGSVFF